jgi:hypothetical protein
MCNADIVSISEAGIKQSKRGRRKPDREQQIVLLSFSFLLILTLILIFSALSSNTAPFTASPDNASRSTLYSDNSGYVKKSIYD